MEKTPTYQCYVGSAGWEHASWLGAFYPEDLPPDWHLTFYNNHFSCVFIPYADWSCLSVTELAAWCNDVMDHFRFVLEANPKGMDLADKEKLAALPFHFMLADSLGKIDSKSGLEGRVVWVTPQPDYKKLAQELQRYIEQGMQVFLISREPDLKVMDDVKRLLEIMGL